ncbi:TRAP transporter small permease [Anaerobacillus sp. MEB173]|uniref:TRAP transporter small permease n=1 Tax=Anaerobacillus sp. MEB173 TaxID=3383345 RepID=UPI003F9170A7
MKALLLKLDRFEEIVSSILLSATVILITLQVFNRYVLSNSLTWSEELARYLFIWSIYLGVSYAVKEGRHLEISFLKTFFPFIIQKVITVIASLLTLLFCIYCVYYGIQLSSFIMGTGQTSPALKLPMYIVYAAVPVGMGLMGIRTIIQCYQVIKSKQPENKGENYL